MKVLVIWKYRLLLILVLLTSVAFAGSLSEKKKTIDKSYVVGGETILQISNQFGDIHLEQWDKQELKIRVEIIVNGKNDDRAESLLQRISVDISEGSTMSFDTEISGNMSTKNDESFEVNYWVKFPSSNKIDLENKFGDIYVDDWRGSAQIELSYGSLKTQNFAADLDLELSFGKGSLGALSVAEIDLKYSDLDIESVGNLEMDQQFSKVSINQVDQLELESKYGEVNLGEVNRINCDAQFTGFSIEKLNNKLYLEASYVNDFDIDELNRNFSKVEIYGKFSSYSIRLQEATNAEFEGEFSYADFSTSNESVDLYYKVKDSNKKEYKAKIGKGDSGKRIVVKSSYGNFKIK